MATIEEFVAVAQGIIDAHHEAEGYRPEMRQTLSIGKGGRKFVRIIRNDGGDQRSVHCFVEKETGAILKPASWKTPAKHPRGNINDPDGGASAMTPYGAKYL